MFFREDSFLAVLNERNHEKSFIVALSKLDAMVKWPMVVSLFIYSYNPFIHRVKIKTVQQGDLNTARQPNWPFTCCCHVNGLSGVH